MAKPPEQWHSGGSVCLFLRNKTNQKSLIKGIFACIQTKKISFFPIKRTGKKLVYFLRKIKN